MRRHIKRSLLPALPRCHPESARRTNHQRRAGCGRHRKPWIEHPRRADTYGRKRPATAGGRTRRGRVVCRIGRHGLDRHTCHPIDRERDDIQRRLRLLRWTSCLDRRAFPDCPASEFPDAVHLCCGEDSARDRGAPRGVHTRTHPARRHHGLGGQTKGTRSSLPSSFGCAAPGWSRWSATLWCSHR